jgi:hypothetical protein
MAISPEDKTEIATIISEALKGDKIKCQEETAETARLLKLEQEKVQPQEIIPTPEPTKTNEELEKELHPPIVEIPKTHPLEKFIHSLW